MSLHFMAQEPGNIVGGKYRLEKPLAKGGMGAVWLARHTELDAPVAVKFMAHELIGTPVAEARFKREAKAAAQLRSPHVVHIHDYGVQDGVPYMVMELLEGEDLGALLAREGKLGVGRVAVITTPIAKALALAHAAGIVHRDLKPSNLFLARSGEDEIVKVLDFGVAKETLPTLVVDKTTSGMLVGSPQYMSPEQARGDPVGIGSDLWSLGVVVFEALVGRPPFVSSHLGALLTKINEAVVDPPTSIHPGLPPAIDAYIARALARNPADRFPSARAMAEELAAIAGAPMTASVVVPAVIEPKKATLAGLAPAIVGRAEATLPEAEPDLPSNEPSPVSTTMGDRAQPPKGDGAARSRAGRSALIAAATVAAVALAWLAFGPSTQDSTNGASTTSVSTSTSGATSSASAPSTASASTGTVSATDTDSPAAPSPGTTTTATVVVTTSAKAPIAAVRTAIPSTSKVPAANTTKPSAAPTAAPYDTTFGLAPTPPK